MQNEVPVEDTGGRPSVASRSVERALGRRRDAYAAEVARLVQASLELISEGGELEPRVSEIVDRSGLSNQAFYRHFRSKDELLVAVLDDGVRQLSSYLRHRMDAVDAPLEQVREWLRGVCAQALNEQAARATRPFVLTRARLSERFGDEVGASEAQLTQMLRDAIEAAKAAGDLADADPQRDAETVYNLAMGWLQRQLAASHRPEPGDADHLLDFALSGLRRGVAG